MVRAIGGIFSAVLGALVGVFVALGAAERRYEERGGEIAAAAVREAMAREGALATRLGMTLRAQGEGTLTERGSLGWWSMPLEIAAEECVAVVVGIDGAQRVSQVAIQATNRAPDEIAEEAMARAHNGGGLVAHAQWCERRAVPRRVVALAERVVPQSQRAARATLRWAVYRAPWATVGGPVRLTRGQLRSESLAVLGDDLAAREAQPLFPADAVPLSARVPLTMGFARLLPSDAGTYGALIRAMRSDANPSVNPRIDPAPVAGAPWNTGLPVDFGGIRASLGGDATVAVHDPVIDLGLNEFRRVLAVVDRAHLGVPCARVALVRGRFAHAARVEALDPDGTRHPLPPRENVALDDRCPSQGPTVYLVPADDHDPWTLHPFGTSQ